MGYAGGMALGLAVLTPSGLLTLAGPPASAEAAASCAGRKVRTLTFDTGDRTHVPKGSGYVCAVPVPRKPARKGTSCASGPGAASGCATRSTPPVP